MIEQQAGTTFTSYLEDAVDGLLDNLTAALVDPDDTAVIAATDDGLTQAADHTYAWAQTTPSGTTFEIVWYEDDVEIGRETLVVTAAPPDDAPAWAPTLADLGTLLRARTVDENNNYLGTFTGATTPTGDQVETLIVEAARDVRRDVGPELDTTSDTALLASAKGLAKYRAAMLVELNYPEQAAADDSSYEKWKMLYDEGLKRLTDSITTDPGDRQGIASIGVSSPTSSEFDQLGAAGRAWYVPDERWPAF